MDIFWCIPINTDPWSPSTAHLPSPAYDSICVACQGENRWGERAGSEVESLCLFASLPFIFDSKMFLLVVLA